MVLNKPSTDVYDRLPHVFCQTTGQYYRKQLALLLLLPTLEDKIRAILIKFHKKNC